MNNVVRPG